PIQYHYTMTNTSSSDSPNLVLDSTNQGSGDRDTFTDTLLGDLEAAACAADGTNDGHLSMAPGSSLSFDVTRTLQANDPKPLTNSAEFVFTTSKNLGSFPNRLHAPTQVAIAPPADSNISPPADHVNAVGDPPSFPVTVNKTIDGVSAAAAGPTVNFFLSDS